MKKGVKLILVSIISFFLTCDITNAATFNNISKISIDNSQPLFDAIELDDGYIIYQSTYNNENYNYNLSLTKITLDNKTEWTNTILVDPPGMSSWANGIQVSDDKAIIALYNETVIIDTKTGELKKENSELMASEIREFKGNYILYSDTNTAFMIDADLNILYKYNLDNELHIEDIIVDNDKIYILGSSSTSVDGNYEYEYSLITLNSEFKEVERKTYSNGDKTDIFSSYTCTFQYGCVKNGNDFYCANHNIYKLSPDGKISLTLGNFSNQDNTGTGIIEDDTTDYSTIKKIDDYLIATGYTIEDGKEYAFVEIYDLKFNLIKKINVNNHYNVPDGYFSVGKDLKPTKKGFMVLGGYHEFNKLDGTAFIAEYEMIYDIISKTDGNGNISSSKVSSPSGELISFRVTPNAGYVLDYVKVTDANGNVVTFTSNTFTMPSADVTIEAVFKRIVNPETATNIIGIALVIMIIIGCTVVINKHKNNIKL